MGTVFVWAWTRNIRQAWHYPDAQEELLLMFEIGQALAGEAQICELRAEPPEPVVCP